MCLMLQTMNNMNIKLNLSEVLRYMGQTQEDETAISIAREAIVSLEKIIQPKYTFTKVDKSILTLEGLDIKSHLYSCEEVYILVATLGADLDRHLRLLQYKSMLSALALDAAAIDAIEKVCDEAELEIIKIEKDNFITKRYSPGYGDFPLGIQPTLVKLTDASRKIGLTVNDNHILFPKKSVTALLGVSKNAVSGILQGCNNCNLAYKCRFKKLGGCNNAKRPYQK